MANTLSSAFVFTYGTKPAPALHVARMIPMADPASDLPRTVAPAVRRTSVIGKWGFGGRI